MADVYYTVGSAGEVWQWLMTWWAEHAGDASISSSYSSGTATFGSEVFVKAILAITDDSGSNTFHFAMLDTRTASEFGMLEPSYVTSTKGFNVVPGAVIDTVGTRDNRAWFGNMYQAKLALMKYCTGLNANAEWQDDGIWAQDDNRTRLYVASFRTRSGLVVMMAMVNLYNEASTYAMLDGQNQVNPYPIGQPGFTGGGGGGSIDITPLVEAVRQIALQDYDIEINNGAAMFSLRSKTRVS